MKEQLPAPVLIQSGLHEMGMAVNAERPRKINRCNI